MDMSRQKPDGDKYIEIRLLPALRAHRWSFRVLQAKVAIVKSIVWMAGLSGLVFPQLGLERWVQVSTTVSGALTTWCVAYPYHRKLSGEGDIVRKLHKIYMHWEALACEEKPGKTVKLVSDTESVLLSSQHLMAHESTVEQRSGQ